MWEAGQEVSGRGGGGRSVWPGQLGIGRRRALQAEGSTRDEAGRGNGESDPQGWVRPGCVEGLGLRGVERLRVRSGAAWGTDLVSSGALGAEGAPVSKGTC